MSILRSEHQVALQELFVMIQESVDHYEDAAEFVDNEATSELFLGIVSQRKDLAEKVAQAIRETDDLPTAPDADREAGTQLLHHLHSLFTRDQTRDVIDQRLQAEQALIDKLATLESKDAEPDFAALRQQFAEHVALTCELLRRSK